VVFGTKKLVPLDSPPTTSSPDSTNIAAIAQQGGLVKHAALITSLLLLSVPAVAQTYSNANLNGNYSFQFGTAQTYNWSKTFTCPTNSLVTYTVNSSQTGTDVVFGVGTFDGNGNLSLAITEIGRQNQTASANTTSVTWSGSCQVVSQNNGHVVYRAATTKTQNGTYSIQSNGTGTMSETGSSQSQTLLLTATNGGLSSTVLITSALVNGKTMGTGIAVHQ
jgi:hypothetical protein